MKKAIIFLGCLTLPVILTWAGMILFFPHTSIDDGWTICTIALALGLLAGVWTVFRSRQPHRSRPADRR